MKLKNQQLLTIGYEGSKIEDFVATLISEQVEILVDIREIPISRKKGFSKKALAASLQSHGLRYIHMRELGDPKPGREAARKGDLGTFKRIFSEHLRLPSTQKAIRDITQLISENNICMLCFERDPIFCHRMMVAKEIELHYSIKARHIGVREKTLEMIND